jgi:DNA primase
MELISDNYKIIINKISIKQILEHYHFLPSMRQEQEKLIGPCPFHKGPELSFKASISKNAFICLVCHVRGNLIDFVCIKENVKIPKAEFLIRKWFNT